VGRALHTLQGASDTLAPHLLVVEGD
jgi:hypothetical protein